MAQARTIAETELDILRIRAKRVKMIGSAAKSSSDPSLTEEPVPEAHAVAAFPASPMQSEDAQHALLGALPQLEALERYERRALSRRRRAIRQMYESSM